MKIKTGVGFAGICLAVAAIAFAREAPTVSEAAKPSLRVTAPAATSVPAEYGMTLAEAQLVLSKEHKYVAHPAPGEGRTQGARRDFEMATPPPAPRTETKTATPEPGRVWVPGHYIPVKGQWRWVRGEWAVPATPSSVWVAASYDPEEKKWSPGYWQPDRPYTSDADLPVKEGASTPNY